jgi:hypothetical protein
MKLSMILCCEISLLDARTNTVSCINLLEEINSPQFPVLMPQFSVVALFDREEGDDENDECEVIIKIGGQELVRAPIGIAFQSGRRHRSLVNLQGFVVPLPGQLLVSISKQSSELGIWEIPVIQQPRTDIA